MVFKIASKQNIIAVDMKFKEVEKVLYFESFMVIEPGLTKLKKNNFFQKKNI